MSTRRSSRTIVVLLLGLSALVAVMLDAVLGRAGAVEVGQSAPEFKLPSTVGNDIALSDFRGKKWVLLEFYGADFSPT
jgi:hypothetical protein